METKKKWIDTISKLQTKDKLADKTFQDLLKIIGRTITTDILSANKLIRIDEDMEVELEHLKNIMKEDSYLTLMIEVHAIMLWLKQTAITNEEYEVAENLTRLGI